MTRRLLLVLTLLIVVLSAGSRCAADSEFPWRRQSPNPNVVVQQVREMVKRVVANGAVAVPAASGYTDAFHYQMIRAYAMMQALPFLAEFSYLDDDGTVKTIAADSNFKAAKTFAVGTFATIQKNAHAVRLEGGTLDAASAEKVRVDLLGTELPKQRTNYAVPLALAFLDAAYTGGLDTEETGFSPSKDRRARAAERPPAEGRRAVARLAALVLAQKRQEFGPDARPTKLYLWSYDECGSSGADMSVTGLAPLALRAAANLDLLSYEKEAFEFPFADGGSLLSREVFLARLADVLVHMVITLAEAGEKHSSASEVEAEWAARKDGKPDDPVDVRRYRTDPVSLPSGIPIRRVVELTGPKLPPADATNATLFYYATGIDDHSGAYFCANAAYATCTCANLLVALLEKSRGATLGKSCPIKPDPPGSINTWAVAVDGGEFRLGLANQSRYTRLLVRGKDGTDLRLDDRIARMFNMIVRMMAQPASSTASTEYYKLRSGPQNNLSDESHKPWYGLHWFALMKSCLATKQHGYDLGPWPWYDSLIDDVVKPGVGQFDIGEGTLDFMIIATVRSYRSVFSREK
jgi:hypothetical protein